MGGAYHLSHLCRTDFGINSNATLKYYTPMKQARHTIDPSKLFNEKELDEAIGKIPEDSLAAKVAKFATDLRTDLNAEDENKAMNFV